MDIQKIILYIICIIALVSLSLLISDNVKRDNIINELNYKIEEQIDSTNSFKGENQLLKNKIDSLETIIYDKDSIVFENFVLKYKINRIKQYDSIVIRNSSQSKYFRGWVRRVIYE